MLFRSPELEPNRLKIPVSHIHHVLAFARMLVGESATMAAEAAVLGVPAVYISPYGRGFTDDLERYGLVRNFTEQRFAEDWLSVVREMVLDPLLADRAKAARERMLRDKVDVTAWMLEFFEREHARKGA